MRQFTVLMCGGSMLFCLLVFAEFVMMRSGMMMMLGGGMVRCGLRVMLSNGVWCSCSH